MVTEAQKRANERYKSKMRAEGAMGSITATFYGKDMALLEYARAHGPAATFVKQLIRERMEAIEAWNTRSERTCKMENAGEVPQNVLESETVWFCSECGAPTYNDMTPSYCIYCGAKVVE